MWRGAAVIPARRAQGRPFPAVTRKTRPGPGPGPGRLDSGAQWGSEVK